MKKGSSGRCRPGKRDPCFDLQAEARGLRALLSLLTHMEIYDLTTEGRKEPLGLDVEQPAFSWKIRGQNAFQTWYRVRVASTRERLSDGRPDLWDSGRVPSAETVAVRYGGAPLRERQVYFWTVETNLGKSPVASFETAFFDRPMPSARWIGMPLAYQGSTDLVRLDFEPEKPVARARLYLAALGCSRCYLNGEVVAEDYFDGAISVYGKRVFYRTYALKVRQGKNALCVELGYGFYGAKKMCAELFLEYEDGSQTVIPTFAGRVWNITAGRVSENSIYGGEVFDARRGSDRYLPGYEVNTKDFTPAYCVDPPVGRLRACPIPPMRVTDRFAPRSLQRREDGSLLADAGKNVCGWLKVGLRGERGAKVTLRYAEVLDENGEINCANLRTARSRDVVILAGEETESYSPSFTYHGFRYVQIRTEGKAEVLWAEVQTLRTDIDVCGSFRCSDPQLNALHEMAALTEANNLNGVFTDCPQRDERLGWLNDMSSRIYESVCNFDLRNFLPNFVNMITDAQAPNGAIGDTVPFSVGSPVGDAVDAYPLLGWLAYTLYGDRRTLEDNYRGFCLWNDYLAGYQQDGVVEWGIYGDWCPAFPFSKGGDGTHSAMVTPQFMAGAYYLWNLALTAQAARALGRGEEAAALEKRRQAGKEAFFRRYLDAEGRTQNRSQTECAVLMTVFPEEKELCKIWAETAARDLKARNFHMTCGNQGYRHLFYRLAEYGFADDLVRLLKNEEYPGWGFMLKMGATTVWERWEFSVRTDMHSFNHPMFAAYDGFLFNCVAGIRMNECREAFGRITLTPCFVRDLDWAEAELDTVRGRISVHWERRGRGIRLRAVTPANTSLTVRAEGWLLRCGGLSRRGELRLGNGAFVIDMQPQESRLDGRQPKQKGSGRKRSQDDRPDMKRPKDNQIDQKERNYHEEIKKSSAVRALPADARSADRLRCTGDGKFRGAFRG